MIRDHRLIWRSWLWLAGAGWVGSATASAAQSLAVGSRCQTDAVYPVLRRHEMPNTVGCPALFVARAFGEMKLPLRVVGEDGLTAIALATHLAPFADRLVISQHPDPGAALAGVVAEISLVAPSPTATTTNGATKSTPIPAAITPAATKADGATTPAAVPTVAVTPARAVAGQPLVFRVTLSAAGDTGQVAADYDVAAGSARAGIDFTPTTGRIVLTPGVPTTLRVPTTPASPVSPARSLTMNVRTGGAITASAAGTILWRSTLATASFAISSTSATVTEGTAFTATITRSGAVEQRAAITANLFDPVACRGIPVRRLIVFGPGDQTEPVSFEICPAIQADARRTVTIVLKSPPRGSFITAGSVNAVVAPTGATRPWLWTAAAASVAAASIGLGRVRFRKRWQHARPAPFPVTASCKVMPGAPITFGHPVSGPAVAIDVQIAIDPAIISRPTRETG